jgi:hypothetical protein
MSMVDLIGAKTLIIIGLTGALVWSVLMAYASRADPADYEAWGRATVFYGIVACALLIIVIMGGG